MTKAINVTTNELHNVLGDGADIKPAIEFIQAGGLEYAISLGEFCDSVNGGNPNALGVSDLIQIAVSAENELKARGISTVNLVGTEIRYIPGFSTPEAYKHLIDTNYVVMTRTISGWRLDRLDAKPVVPNQPDSLKMDISEAAERDIMQKSFSHIQVRKAL